MPTPSDAPVPLDLRLLAPLPREVAEVRADRLLDGLWCLRIPLPYDRPRFVNCYLLETDDGQLLVDCGPAAGVAWPGLAHALALAGARPAEVSTLLLTHLHADHASLAETVIRETGCRLWRGAGPDTIYDRLRDPIRPLAARRPEARREGVPPHEIDDVIAVPLAHDAPPHRPTPDRLLAPGAIVPTRVGPWTVVPTPGHAPAQIGLFHAGLGWMLSADVAYPEGQPYLEWGHTPDPFGESLGSLARVRALAPTRILAGHGRHDDEPAARIAAAEVATGALLDATRAELSTREPRSAYAVTCRMVGDDPDPDVRGSTLSVVLCAVEHLVAIGAAVEDRAGADGIRRFLLA